MVTVLRPPFWVPRPADDTFWQGTPVDSPVIPFLTKQTIYGKGGEVPPFRWNATYDDPPMWQGQPDASATISLLTAVKFFGQGGQGRPFRWNFTYDDSSYWVGAPLASDAIPLLTAVKIYGQGGQAPPFRANFTYDDPPPWQPTAETLNSGVIQLLTEGGPPVKPAKWNQNYDDAPMWQGAPADAAAISMLTVGKVYGQGGQVPPFRWNATYDDAAFWQGAPGDAAAVALLTFTKLYGQGGQVAPFRPNFTYDDASPCSWQPQGNPNIFVSTTTTPFNNRQTLWYSEDAIWQGGPTDAAAIALLTFTKLFGAGGQVVPFRPNLTIDDPPMWQGAPVPPGHILITTTVVFPFNLYAPTFAWAVSYDDSPMWVGMPTGSVFGLNVPLLATLRLRTLMGVGL